MNIKDKILSDINADKASTLGIFADKDEYLRLWNVMAPLNLNYNIASKDKANLCEDFNFNIYTGGITSNFDVNYLQEILAQNANVIVTINGYLDTNYSKITSPEVRIFSMTNKLPEAYHNAEIHFKDFYEERETPVSVMNNLLTRDGVYIDLQAESKILEPIYLVNIVTQQPRNYLFNSRKLVSVGNNASAEFIELNLIYSEFAPLHSEMFMLDLAIGAKAKYTRINVLEQNRNQKSTNQAFFIKEYGFHLATNARLTLNNININSPFNLTNSFTMLNGEGAEINDTWFVLAGDEQNVKLNTTLLHNTGNTKSNQLFKTLANDSAKVNFNSNVLINKKASGAEALQNNRTILLSDNAEVDFSPQMEIYNDDVKASHGVAIGTLDAEQIFYLNSRGIDTGTAKKLLLTAFAKEVLGNINSDKIVEYLLGEIECYIDS